MKLLKTCRVKRMQLSPELGDIFTDIWNVHGKTPPTAPWLSEKENLYWHRASALTAEWGMTWGMTWLRMRKTEELQTLRETMIFSFEGNGKNWDTGAPGGADGSCHQWSWTRHTANSDAEQNRVWVCRWRAHRARDRFAIVLRQERLKWVPCERTRARWDWEVKEKGSLEA